MPLEDLVSTVTFGCREYAMRNIADLLVRFWQGYQPASETQVAAVAEHRDQSSMADFVRILQAYDQDQWGDRVRSRAVAQYSGLMVPPGP
ncbi:hypothetical protein ACM43_15450 [Bradyrhizobium sp. CCBAU 45321]|nr:hypothetical protein [Bradyrhizobium sp. CCBAU 45321]